MEKDQYPEVGGESGIIDCLEIGGEGGHAFVQRWGGTPGFGKFRSHFGGTGVGG